ncbi:MAG: hypothetical protein ACREX8_21225, partial [Gammaproteobacteria bacterium]
MAAALGFTSVAIFGALSLGTDATSTDTPSRAEVQQLFERLPVRFEVNQGQAPGKVDYLARGPGYT